MTVNYSINKILFAFFAAILFFGCSKKSGESAGPPNSFRRYPYENVHITYEISGDGRGSEEVFIAGYGKYEAEYSRTEVFTPQGIRPENHTLLTRLAESYTIDNMQKKYLHKHIPTLDSLYHLDPKDLPTPAQYLQSEMQRAFFKNTGQDSIAGKRANRWDVPDGNLKMWTWNGILLRKTMGGEGANISMTIKSIDTLWNADTTKFLIPAGYTEDQFNPEEPDAPEPN